MSLEELSKKYQLRLSLVQRAAEMLRVIIEIEYLDEKQKIQILDYLLTANDQPPLSKAQESCLQLGGQDIIDRAEELLSPEEFTGMILSLGLVAAEQHLESALQEIFSNHQQTNHAEKDVNVSREDNDKATEFEEQWTEANQAWINAGKEWEKTQNISSSWEEIGTETIEMKRLPEINSDSLPSDNWEVGLLIYDPINRAHNLTLLRSGVQDQKIVPKGYNAVKNGDIDKSAGALKQWGKANPNDKQLEALSTGAHCPHMKNKRAWALSLASKAGNYDRIFLICIRLEHPNPSIRIEKAKAKGVNIERKRFFEFQGLGASCRSEAKIQWPSSHSIQDAKEPEKSGWGIFSQRGARRTVGEKWQARAGWSLEFSQIKGPASASELRIEEAGSAALNISASGSHHGHIDAHSAAFIKIGHKGEAPIRLNAESPPKNLVWENTIDYHTNVLKIPRAMDEIDLMEHSVDLTEKRRPTVGGTRPFSSETHKQLNGALALKSGTISGYFVAETKLTHENQNQDQNCDFIGQAVSAWAGDLRFTLPLTPTESIVFEFTQGKEESCLEPTPINPAMDQRVIERCRRRVATVKGPHFMWEIDQVATQEIVGWSTSKETVILHQQGWDTQFESPARNGKMEMRVELGRAQTGFRLRKGSP